MRIAHVITRGDVGGAQTHVVELATSQHRAGQHVAVIAGVDGAALQRLRGAGVGTVVVPALGRARRNPWSPAAFRDVRAAIGEIDPDIVHAHSSNAGVLARVASARDRRPCVYTAHGWPFQRGAPLPQRLMSIVGEIVGGRVGDAVICLTEAEAERARRARIARPDRIFVIPNGLADRPPTSVGVVDGAPSVVMVARFAPPKLQRELVSVMSTMLDTPWKLVFVGDGPDLAETEVFGRQLLGDRVQFLGHRDDVHDVLSASSVAVLWSRYEGMPISLIEAMRAGVPCVGSDLPGVRAVLGDPPAGAVAGSPDRLAAELRALLMDPDRRTDLGRVARQRFEAHFSIDAVRIATQRVYDDVLARVARTG